MNICVIVVTFNGIQWLEKCFNSLINSTVQLSIIAVDNNSQDGTPKQIKEKYPQVELIETGENLGFGKANNIGLKKAIENNADFVFLLNQDAWIEPDTVSKLIEISLNNKQYGIISPLHMNGQGTDLDFNFSIYVGAVNCSSFISDYVTGKVKNIYETNFVNAAAWLITRDCLHAVGGFDPIFPHYGEDDDYIKRAAYHGFKIGISPLTQICHDRVCKSSKKFIYDENRIFTININLLKNYSGSFRFNLLFFLKNQFDTMTTHLILRDFKAFNCRVRALIKTFKTLNRIKRSKAFCEEKNSKVLLSEKEIN